LMEMATQMRYAEKYREAEEWYAKSISTLEAVLKRDSALRNREARSVLVYSSMNRAENWLHQRRMAEENKDSKRAIELGERAIEDWKRAIDLGKKPSTVELQIKRAQALARIGEYLQAIGELEAFGQAYEPSALHWYDMACTYSISQSAALKDIGLSPDERSERAEHYGDRALDLLKKSRQAGFFNAPGFVEQLKVDPDLESLHSRRDFQKFVRDVEQDAKEGSPNNKK
jgi:tetratricopeptide (TPR) repeat protein